MVTFHGPFRFQRSARSDFFSFILLQKPFRYCCTPPLWLSFFSIQSVDDRVILLVWHCRTQIFPEQVTLRF